MKSLEKPMDTSTVGRIALSRKKASSILISCIGCDSAIWTASDDSRAVPRAVSTSNQRSVDMLMEAGDLESKKEMVKSLLAKQGLTQYADPLNRMRFDTAHFVRQH